MSTAELVSASATELAQAIRFLKTIQPMAKLAAELLGLWFRWDQWRSAMLGWMQSHDLVLCPVSATPALPHGTAGRTLPAFSYAMIYSLTASPTAGIHHTRINPDNPT